MNLDFAVACDYAVIDRFGKLSVMGIFQHVWVANFPAVHPRLHLVLKIKGKRTELGSHNIEINFTDSGDAVLLKGSGTVTLNEPPAGILEIEAGAILVFDIPLPHEGQDRCEISVDNQLDTVVPLTASQRIGPVDVEGTQLH